jgi:asparagine synthase (glutamine-hydrolysing)
MSRITGLLPEKPSDFQINAPQIARQGLYRLGLEGSVFNASADTILQSILHIGFEAALQKLDGDFALVFYDAPKNELYLARDRFGTKPLYHTTTADRVYFASELQSLLQCPGVSRIPNASFVARFAGSHYRMIDNQPTHSPYQNIQQVPARHYCVFAKNQVRTVCYWDLQEQSNLDNYHSVSELVEHYQFLLRDSVKKRLQVAHKPCFTLSGGMDSSSVLSCAVLESGQKQVAFSSVYSDKQYDESDDIQTILNDCVSQWHPVLIDAPDVINLTQKMIALHAEPVATATWLSHYLLCEQVQQAGFSSLFGGLGGDELNAGEYEHFYFFFADLKQNSPAPYFDKEVAAWVHHHNHPIFQKNPATLESALSQWTGPIGRCLPDLKRLHRYAHTLSPDFYSLTNFQPTMLHPFQSYLKNRTYQDIFYETIPCCLRAEDRHTAAFGLNNFLPFLDHRLAEFMFRIPETLKIKDGVSKYLLREAMKGIVPESTRTRVKKTGWNAPAHIWFSGQGAFLIRDILSSQAFKTRGIYNIPVVEKLLQEHDDIIQGNKLQDNHMMFFWQLVNTELWHQWLESVPENSLVA